RCRHDWAWRRRPGFGSGRRRGRISARSAWTCGRSASGKRATMRSTWQCGAGNGQSQRGRAGDWWPGVFPGHGIGEILRSVVDVIRRNPVRVRALVVAVLVAAGWALPEVVTPEVQDVVVGAVMTLAALAFGWDAARRVEL